MNPIKMHASDQTRTYLVSYATGRFVNDQADLMASGLRFGITDPRPWSNEVLRATRFYSEHKTMLDMERGAGYWLWKPFIMLETLREMQDGDCLIYSDAGVEIIADLTPLVRATLETPAVKIFRGNGEAWEFTKRDCFFFLNADEPRYHHAPMADASFIVCMKTAQACEFIAEWLEICLDPRILTDQPNTCGLPNLPGFKDHRHDQSILSLLAKRNNFELIDYPFRYLNHHRGRHAHARNFVDEQGRTVVALEIPAAFLIEKMRRRHR